MSLTSSSPLRAPVSATPMRFHSLAEWLSWQEGLHFTAVDLGLDRCYEVAVRIGLLTPDFMLISIAGTNGKGSSAAMLDLILRNAGYRVGNYTSPHLLRYNERIRVDGVEIDDDTLCQSFNRIDQARADISLTYFEFGTLAAIDFFHRSGVEIAILEVGLGGRLDAVNILDADVALVCSIDLDHENWLGHDREVIGAEKAGIFRAARPAICSDLNPPSSIIGHAAAIGSDLSLAGRDFGFQIGEDSWSWRSGLSVMKDLPKPDRFNDSLVQNAAGVLKILDVVSDRYPVDNKTVYESLQNFRLPGRFQRVPGKVSFVLDVAHNRQSAEVLAENLGKLGPVRSNHIVIGMLKDKDHSAVFQALSEFGDFWHLVTLDSERAADSQMLAEELYKMGNSNNITLFEAIDTALQQVCAQARTGDRVVVTGSFLTVGAAIRWLNIED
ncbi:MAG: bifunctional tetrahydrofolate synthase/dihydrofolate synthase [Gammaproteobacteria bacterium]